MKAKYHSTLSLIKELNAVAAVLNVFYRSGQLYFIKSSYVCAVLEKKYLTKLNNPEVAALRRGRNNIPQIKILQIIKSSEHTM